MNLNFNKDKLYKLLRSFYILSGIRIVIYDIDYNEVISYPPNNCSYCKLMDQKKCQLSNNKAFLKCKESDDLYIYHCHANLVEAMINLKINGEIVGFIMFGQFSDIANEEKRVNLLKNNTSKNVLSSIQEIKYLDDEKLQSASTILLSLAKYAISEKMVSIEQEKFINQINDFIEKNYVDPRTTEITFPEKKRNLIYIFQSSGRCCRGTPGYGRWQDTSWRCLHRPMPHTLQPTSGKHRKYAYKRN